MNARKTSVWVSGLALFSMFFGAGNVVFPLALGQTAGAEVGYGLFGLLITAILFPLIGLMAMMLYRGSYDTFFGRIGHLPGRAVLLIVNLVVWVGVPRLITLSHAALAPYLPGLSLSVYSILAAGVIFLFAMRPGRIIGLLGSVLTPILLLALGLIITLGLLHQPDPGLVHEPVVTSFVDGLKVGYQTLDLIAAFLFATLVMGYFRHEAKGLDPKQAQKSVTRQFVKAAVIAAGLLGFVYAGMCLVAARYAHALTGVASEGLIGDVARLVLGPWGGLVSSVAVAMACLTTAISCAAIFGGYASKYWFSQKLGRTPCLLGSLIAAAFMANLGFGGIMRLLDPIVDVAYPGLIVLSFLNIVHKLYEFRPIKIPVMATFGAAAISHFV